MTLASSISVVTYSLSYLCGCRVKKSTQISPTNQNLTTAYFEFTLPKKYEPLCRVHHASRSNTRPRIRWHADEVITLLINFLQTGWISLDSEALNIITCFSWGVIVNISWISRRMSTEMKCSNSSYCMCIQQHIQSCSSILSHSSNIKCFM